MLRYLWSVLLLVSCSTLIGVDDSRVQGACTSDAECAPEYACLLGSCRNGCAGDQECDAGARCLKALGTSACVPSTADCAAGCPDGTTCADSVCRTDCTTTEDCAGDQTCQRRVCVGTDTTRDSGATGGAASGTGGEPSGGGGPYSCSSMYCFGSLSRSSTP